MISVQRHIILFAVLCVFSSMTNAQVAVTNFPPYDNEENLVVDVLLGSGIVASNFSSIGFANGIGYFDGFNSNIGFDEGVFDLNSISLIPTYLNFNPLLTDRICPFQLSDKFSVSPNHLPYANDNSGDFPTEFNSDGLRQAV